MGSTTWVVLFLSESVMRFFVLPLLSASLLLSGCLSPEERYQQALLQGWVGTEVIGEGRVDLPETWTTESGVEMTMNVYFEARASGAAVLTFDYQADGYDDTEVVLTGDWRQLSIRPEAFDVDLSDEYGELDGDCVIAEDLATMSCDLEGGLYEFAARGND